MWFQGQTRSVDLFIFTSTERTVHTAVWPGRGHHDSGCVVHYRPVSCSMCACDGSGCVVEACVSGESLMFPGSLTIRIISASSAFSLWTPGEVAALGHGGTGALQEPHSQLHTRLHCGCGCLRHYKWVSLMSSWSSVLSYLYKVFQTKIARQH